MFRQRTTLKDIANSLNVSVTTVSRALNDKSDISSDTKKKVQEVAKMMGYKPNTMAISLRKKSARNVIGVILPTVDHYFFGTVLKGIIDSAITSNYIIMIGESDHDVQKEENLIDQFSDHFVGGLIFVPSRNEGSKTNAQIIRSRSIPLVLIDRTFSEYEGSYVQHDDYQGAYNAVEHLILQGRKRIGFFRGDERCSISNERYRGFKDALAQFDIREYDNLIMSCPDATPEEAERGIEHIFEQSEVRPDAIFTITDRLAAGIYQFARKNNLRIPSDLSVVGYSNSDLSSFLSPLLTTVEQNGIAMGKAAMRFILEQIDNPKITLKKTFDSRLIVRESSIVT